MNRSILIKKLNLNQQKNNQVLKKQLEGKIPPKKITKILESSLKITWKVYSVPPFFRKRI